MGVNASKQLHNTLFELNWTAKSLVRASNKSKKQEKVQKVKLKNAIEKGNYEGARIYAANVRVANRFLTISCLFSSFQGMNGQFESSPLYSRYIKKHFFTRYSHLMLLSLLSSRQLERKTKRWPTLNYRPVSTA